VHGHAVNEFTAKK